MNEIILKNVKYTNIPNKRLGTRLGTEITQANFDEENTVEFIKSQNFYKLVNSVDIDWNGIEINENTILNDTSDLINLIISLKNEIKSLKDRINKIDHKDDDTSDDESDDKQSLNATYNGGGETQLYNV